ncbi:MAG: Stp1/IreP family PP2C-type Ser/Thr phosphatase [Nitrospiraceae bacterium]
MSWYGTGITDCGRVRRSNQDAFAVLNDHAIWIVADGMGGRAGGDVASRLAVDTLVSALAHDRTGGVVRDLSGDGLGTALGRAVRSSNQAIRDEALKRPALLGMGTTVVIAAISQETSEMTLAHVGDSRAYLLRGSDLTRLTRDHSFVEDALSQGQLTVEEALEHPLRHVLTRALGPETDVDPDLMVHPLQRDDVLLLCTDGLTKMLSDAHIMSLLARTRESPDRACAALVEEANRRGGDDNISVILVRNELTKQGAGL